MRKILSFYQIKILAVISDTPYMAGLVKKFQNRATRYTIRPTDDQLIRVVPQKSKHLGADTVPSIAQFSKIVDISMSGLSFVTDRGSAPFILDVINVEIPLGDGKQLAWTAKVTRVSEYVDPWEKKSTANKPSQLVRVGAQFIDLPSEHAKLIQTTIDKKMYEVSLERRIDNWKRWAAVWAEQIRKALYILGALVAAFYIFKYLLGPHGNYDPEKGAPWGQRFPALNFFGNGEDDAK